MHEVRAHVLVVGAGPAGLAAAAAACEAGADVLVVDEGPAPGGQIWREARGAGARPETAALRERAAGARLLSGITVFDAVEPTVLRGLDASGGTVALRSERVVLAPGATELLLPFPGWTLPGVLGVGGLQAMVKGGLDVSGRRVAVAGSGPLMLAVAASLRAAGARVVGVFEQAPRAAVTRFGLGLARRPRKLAQAGGLLGRLRGVPRRFDAWPVRAEGVTALERVVLSVGGREEEHEVDFLACAFGLVPATGLATLIGCETAAGRVLVDDEQRTTVDGVWCAGESTGIGGVDAALAEGEVAGRAAAGDLAGARAAAGRVRAERRFAVSLERAFELRDELRALPGDTTLVCRCEDVPWSAVRARRDARQAKLETRCGMGACQGRVCGAALQFLCGWERDRPRSPLVPVPFTALADSGPARDTSSPPVQEISP